MAIGQLKTVVAASGQTGCDIETANFEPVDARNRFTLKSVSQEPTEVECLL
jgi:hypothetical protein